MQLLITILGFILFISLVLVHEWGHFIAARRNGVDVEEFGLGFPPRAYGKKIKNGTLLSLNWLPLGGFVKLKGEHDADKRKGSFGAASLGVKTKILLAGVTMNLLVGLLLLTLLAAIGMPQMINRADYGQDQFTVSSDTRISKQEVLLLYIEPDSPAAKAGLKNLDEITQIGSSAKTYRINTPAQLKDATQALAGQQVMVTVKRSGNELSRQLRLRPAAEVEASIKAHHPKGNLGVTPYSLVFTKSTWSSPVVAVGLTGQLIELTAKGLWHALAGLGSIIAGAATNNHQARVNGQDAATAQIGGPLAIFKILTGSSILGVNYMLAIIALISLTLAFMNVLPIPALDGGRLFVMLVSRGILKKPLSKTMEERIHGAGMAVLLILIVLITIVDVKRFF